jgi:DNA-binding NarL/FixJ family response regulator
MSAILNRSYEPICVGLVADEPMRMEGLASAFDGDFGDGKGQLIPIIGSLGDLIANLKVQCLVLDLNSSSDRQDPLEAIQRIRPDIRLIVIGAECDDQLVMNSIKAGARGFLDQNAGPEVLRQAIDVVSKGSIWAPRRLLSRLIDRLLVGPTAVVNAELHITDRERQVLELILMARSNREIAGQLGIEERTVKAHVGRLMRKTGADNRIGLSLCALNHSLVSRPETIERRRGDR